VLTIGPITCAQAASRRSTELRAICLASSWVAVVAVTCTYHGRPAASPPRWPVLTVRLLGVGARLRGRTAPSARATPASPRR